MPAVRVKREKSKCDPKLVQVARELRDRWLEAVNDDPTMLTSEATYDVGKAPRIAGEGSKALLPAA